MSLTGRATFFTALALVLASIVLVSLLWNRVPRRGWLRWPLRVSMVVLCQVTACALAAIALNDTDRFYNSWSELVGGHQDAVSTAHAQRRPSFTAELDRQLALHHHHGGSAVVSMPVTEAGLARTDNALVYLPAAYFDAKYATRQFPVIELLDGFPGSPQTWVGPLHLQHVADAEIAAGRALPFVAVMPVQNFLPGGRDGECLDVPSGPQVESTLVTAVRAAMVADLRVSSDRRAWAVMGYSTGGYCALKIALRFPDLFASAVSILGNTSPYADGNVSGWFASHPGLRDQNDPVWLITHRPQPDLAVLLAGSSGDQPTQRAAVAFASLAHAPLRVQLNMGARGGHNFHTFGLFELVGFDWLSGQLRPSLVPGARVTKPAPRHTR